MAITYPEHGDFPSALTTAISAGVTRVPLTFSWRSLEPDAGDYNDRSLAIAALMIPAMGVSIDLAITPVSGSKQVMPRDLMGRSFDDPDVISRYLQLLEHVLKVLVDADVQMVLVGIEADIYLGDDSAAWNSYAIFTAAAADLVHQYRPGTEVGVQSSTYSRLKDSAVWAGVDKVCDVIASSYFHLVILTVRVPSDLAGDIVALTALYPDRTIRIVESGFPSSHTNGSSSDLQAAFIHALFAAWDAHADQILSITLWTEHDYSPYQLDSVQRSLSDESRKTYIALLGSLGLREWNDEGQPKPAWQALLDETEARGWQP
jgi:hypothetical protein